MERTGRAAVFWRVAAAVLLMLPLLSTSWAADQAGPPQSQESGSYMVSDPLEPWNRAMFSFNNFVYFHATKPVATGYAKVVPKPARVGVKHFFHNLAFPIRWVNELLQGRPKEAQEELFSFLVNTTMGCGGFLDAASHFETLATHQEDTGQTFARWGMGQGIYIVWPLLGPSTARDSLGFVGDYVMDPVSWVNPLWLSFSVRGYDVVNRTSLSLGEYQSLLENSFDPYTAVKDAYLQHRRAMVAK